MHVVGGRWNVVSRRDGTHMDGGRRHRRLKTVVVILFTTDFISCGSRLEDRLVRLTSKLQCDRTAAFHPSRCGFQLKDLRAPCSWVAAHLNQFDQDPKLDVMLPRLRRSPLA